MTVQITKIIDDIQQCVYAFLASFTAAPWSSWTVILGYPESNVFKEFTKPFLYVMQPQFVQPLIRQQGGLSRAFYDITIGAWDHRKVGGPEEINIMTSAIMNVFRNPYTAHTTTFNVITDSQKTGTTLLAEGIEIYDVLGSREIPTENRKEFRSEVTIRLLSL